MEKLERLRELSREELAQKISEHQEEIFNLRLTRTTKDLDNPIRLRSLRREIAKIKTLLREDDLGTRKLAEPRTLGDKAPEKNKSR
jgi:large subunit ribosomal protein L29